MDEPDRLVRTVSLGNILVCVRADDHAFKALMDDPRARVVDRDGLTRGAEEAVDRDAVYLLGGRLGPLTYVALHYWRNDVDFDYVDIGANYGLTVSVEAIFYARAGKVVRCHAFEPGPVFAMLRRTLAANGLEASVACHRCAASDVTGTAAFHVSDTASAASSLQSEAAARHNPEKVRIESVRTQRLDDYAPNLSPSRGLIVKIDAEGADFRVLAGMSALMRERLCTILVEFTPELVREYADPLATLVELSESHLFLQIVDGTFRPMLGDPVWLALFITGIEVNERGMTDLLLIPKILPKCADLYARLLI